MTAEPSPKKTYRVTLVKTLVVEVSAHSCAEAWSLAQQTDMGGVPVQCTEIAYDVPPPAAIRRVTVAVAPPRNLLHPMPNEVEAALASIPWRT